MALFGSSLPELLLPLAPEEKKEEYSYPLDKQFTLKLSENQMGKIRAVYEEFLDPCNLRAKVVDQEGTESTVKASITSSELQISSPTVGEWCVDLSTLLIG